MPCLIVVLVVVEPITDGITACSAGHVSPLIIVYIDWCVSCRLDLSEWILMVVNQQDNSNVIRSALNDSCFIQGKRVLKASAGFRGFKLVKILILDQAVYFVV